MEEDPSVKNLIDCFKHEIQSHEYEILTLKLQGVGGYLKIFRERGGNFYFFLKILIIF
jgi:hypothetical protein